MVTMTVVLMTKMTMVTFTTMVAMGTMMLVQFLRMGA